MEINYIQKIKNNQSSDAIEFTTKTTVTLAKYANMSIEEVIDEINIIGFILFLFDDGWIRKDTKQFCISGGSLTKNQLELFCMKCEYLGIKNVHIIGKKRYDISIPKENNELIIKNVLRLFPPNIDIVRKKLYFIYNK